MGSVMRHAISLDIIASRPWTCRVLLMVVSAACMRLLQRTLLYRVLDIRVA